MIPPLRVLLVEDSPGDAQLLLLHLRQGGFEPLCTRVDTLPAVAAALDQALWDVVLADYALTGCNAFDVLRLVQERGLDLPFIIVSGLISQDTAIQMMRAGGQDYIGKADLSRLVPAIERELRGSAERRGRRAAEDALRRSEHRFRTLIEHSFDGIALLGPDSTIQYFSPALYRMLGYAEEELLGTNLLALLHPDDHNLVAAQHERLVQHPGATARAEYRIAHRDGAHVWLEVLATNLLEEPSVAAIVLNAREYNEHKWAEAEYTRLLDREHELFTAEQAARARTEQAEANLQAIIADSPLPIVTYDLAGLVQRWNPAAHQLLGWSAEEVIGKPSPVVPLEQQQEFDELRARALQGEALRNVEIQRRIRDGSVITLQLSAAPLRDGTGQIIGTMALYADLTARKRAEAALATERDLLHTLMDNIPDFIYFKNRESRFTRINKAQARNLGVDSVEEAVGKTDFDYFPRELAQGLYDGEQQIMATGEPLINLLEDQQDRVHEPRWFLSTKVPIVRDGQVMGLVGTTRDITELQLAEQRSQRHLKRLAALRTIDTAITASLDLRFTLGIVLDQVIGQLTLDAAGLLLFSAYTHTLEYVASRGLPRDRQPRARLRLDESLAGRAVLERRLISVPDLREEAYVGSSGLAEDGFVAYIALPLLAKGQVKGVLELFHRTALHPDEEWLDFLEALAGQAAIAIDNAALFEGLQRSNLELSLAYDTTIEGWSRALDLRDKETEGHSRRVTELTLQLAALMSIGEADLVHLRRGALLHDIGKMGIPDSILLKPGPLSEEEWVVMRRHPIYAYELLSPIAYLRPAIDIPYCHHEKWDGTGYPQGLAGTRIPLAARIFAVADIWDALRSDRPYRAGWPVEKVLEHIRSLAGTHLDPQVVEAFQGLAAQDRLLGLYPTCKDAPC